MLLYDFTEERKANYKQISGKYCIIYSYDINMNDIETVQAIQQYAKDKGLKIYSVGYYHKWCDKNISLSPLELFAYFENAECVFTDTFHGTVLSLVCNTQFVTKISGNGNKLGFLLNQYGVADRRAETFSEITEITSKKIDYEVVNSRIEEIRKQSLDYLKTAIGGNA